MPEMPLLALEVTGQVQVVILLTSAPSNYWLLTYMRPFIGLIKDMIPTINIHSNTQNIETYIYRRPVFLHSQRKSHEFTLMQDRAATPPCRARCSQQSPGRAPGRPGPRESSGLSRLSLVPSQGTFSLSPLFLAVFFSNAKWALSPPTPLPLSLSLFLSLSAQTALFINLSRDLPILCLILCHWLSPWKSSEEINPKRSRNASLEWFMRSYGENHALTEDSRKA